MQTLIDIQIGSIRLRDSSTKCFSPPVPIMKQVTQKQSERFCDSVAGLLADCYRDFENKAKGEPDDLRNAA